MVAVYREDRIRYIQIWVFIVHNRKFAMFEVKRWVAAELQLHWFIPHCVFSKQLGYSIHHPSRRLVLMKQISTCNQ